LLFLSLLSSAELLNEQKMGFGGRLLFFAYVSAKKLHQSNVLLYILQRLLVPVLRVRLEVRVELRVECYPVLLAIMGFCLLRKREWPHLSDCQSSITVKQRFLPLFDFPVPDAIHRGCWIDFCWEILGSKIEDLL
jgi:hypothetical protein